MIVLGPKYVKKANMYCISTFKKVNEEIKQEIKWFLTKEESENARDEEFKRTIC